LGIEIKWGEKKGAPSVQLEKSGLSKSMAHLREGGGVLRSGGEGVSMRSNGKKKRRKMEELQPVCPNGNMQGKADYRGKKEKGRDMASIRRKEERACGKRVIGFEGSPGTFLWAINWRRKKNT